MARRHPVAAMMNPLPDQPARPLRILHLTAGSDAGGVSRYLFDLCTAMHSAGHQVSIAGERGAWHGLFESAPFEWIEAPLKGNPLALRRAAAVLARHLQTGPPIDVLHVHYRRCTWVGRRLQRLLAPQRCPLLYTLHLSHLKRRWFTDFGDHVHVASIDAKQWLIGLGVPAERITLIPHGVDVNHFAVASAAERTAARAALNLKPDDTVAAFIGRFDTPKNEDWLLDIPTPARLLVVGEGPHEASLRQRIERQRLGDRVRLLVGRRDSLSIYRAADALLLPSTREGFSYVCAEAMSCGLAVLRTATSGTAELIVEGATGCSTPIEHDAFVTAASAFLSDRPALARMGAHAAVHIRQHLTFDRQLTQTLALYERLR